MVTAEIFENLKNLQGILVEKYDLEDKVESAPKQLSNQEDLLAKTKKDCIAQQAECDAIEARVAELKVELDEAVKSREEGENGVANSTTHREFEAFEKSIAEATAKEEEVRKLLQKEEKDLAEKKERLDILNGDVEFQTSELNTSKESLNSELDGYKEQLSALQAEEDKITPNLDQEILFKFQRIIQRNSEGIVAVRNGVCTGCHMILPANFANEVREGENIKFCPYCSRILFYEEVSDEQQEDFFNIGVAGSLAGFDDEDDDDESEDENEDKRFEDEDLDADSENSDDDTDEDSDEE